MKDLSIIIIYQPNGDAIRSRNFDFVFTQMRKMFPEAEIVVTNDPSGEKEFCRSHAINQGVKIATHDTLIIMDADIYVKRSALMRAINLLPEHKFVLPFGIVKDLIPNMSEKLLSGDEPDEETLFWNTYADRDIRECRCAGGVQVITKEFFNSIGGYDERFIGWGYEDTAFCLKAERFLGEFPILEDVIFYHLYHDRNQKWHKNQKLCLQVMEELGYDNSRLSFPK